MRNSKKELNLKESFKKAGTNLSRDCKVLSRYVGKFIGDIVELISDVVKVLWIKIKHSKIIKKSKLINFIKNRVTKIGDFFANLTEKNYIFFVSVLFNLLVASCSDYINFHFIFILLTCTIFYCYQFDEN